MRTISLNGMGSQLFLNKRNISDNNKKLQYEVCRDIMQVSSRLGFLVCSFSIPLFHRLSFMPARLRKRLAKVWQPLWNTSIPFPVRDGNLHWGGEFIW